MDSPIAGALTGDPVRWILVALRDGTMSRQTACSLVEPYVVGRAPADDRAESIAQSIHGFDMVQIDGRVSHQRSPELDAYFVISRDQMIRTIDQLLAGLQGPCPSD